MSSPELKHMGLTEARANLTEVAAQARLLGAHVALTRRDKVQAIVVPEDWYKKAVAAMEQQDRD